MKTWAIFLIFACLLSSAQTVTNFFVSKTLPEKVTEAELIVRGIATLEGSPPDKSALELREYRVVVLQALWPINQLVTNTLVIQHDVSDKWPDAWWNFHSQTGIYFLASATNQWMKIPEGVKRRIERHLSDPRIREFADEKWPWRPITDSLADPKDWFELDTNVITIKRLIESSKN